MPVQDSFVENEECAAVLPVPTEPFRICRYDERTVHLDFGGKKRLLRLGSARVGR